MKQHPNAYRHQNNRKPIGSGLCNYKNCRQVAQMLDDYCGKHTTFNFVKDALAEEVQVSKADFMKKFDDFVAWLKGGRS